MTYIHLIWSGILFFCIHLKSKLTVRQGEWKRLHSEGKELPLKAKYYPDIISHDIKFTATERRMLASRTRRYDRFEFIPRK